MQSYLVNRRSKGDHQNKVQPNILWLYCSGGKYGNNGIFYEKRLVTHAGVPFSISINVPTGIAVDVG